METQHPANSVGFHCPTFAGEKIVIYFVLIFVKVPIVFLLVVIYHGLQFWLWKHRQLENILHIYLLGLSSDDFERD